MGDGVPEVEPALEALARLPEVIDGSGGGLFEESPLEAMTHRLATPEGRQLYALRKQTPEPVFGIIKSAMGFRQFSLRGLDKVTGEWNLVTPGLEHKENVHLAIRLSRRPDSVPREKE